MPYHVHPKPPKLYPKLNKRQELRIEAYMRTVENSCLDEYYERGRHRARKLKKYTKGLTRKKTGQMRKIGRGKKYCDVCNEWTYHVKNKDNEWICKKCLEKRK